MKNRIVAGLDIGTSSVKLLVAEYRGNDWDVVSYNHLPSFGLRKGAVSNVDEVSRNAAMLASQAEKDYGSRINSVFVSIGGSHLHTIPSDGLISVSRADHIISQEDVDRVIQAARAVSMSENDEILDVFTREFIVDEQKGIEHPQGLNGVRLQAKVVLLCYFKKAFLNLTQAVINARLQIEDVIPSPLAAAEAVLTRQQKEIGAAVIDIGSATTSIAVFEEGGLAHLAVVPMGSEFITHDLAIGLRTEVAVAEEIKKQHGACLADRPEAKKVPDSQKRIEFSGAPQRLSFTKKDLVRIVEPRVSEMLDLAQRELKKIGRQEQLPGGVVFTGGGAKIARLQELAQHRLRLPCAIGVPRGMIGLPEDPALATVAGLVMSSPYFSGDSEDAGILGWDFFKQWGSKIRRMFRVFIP